MINPQIVTKPITEPVNAAINWNIGVVATKLPIQPPRAPVEPKIG